MGAVQRLATVVILGAVALAGVLVLYLSDESNRLSAQEEEQIHDAVERGQATYLSQCLACHGPAGEGRSAPGEMGTGRIGAPLGGDTYATELNQTGLTADGVPWSDPANPQFGSGLEGRANYINWRIHNGVRASDGTYIMPAFGAELNGPLNDAQIEELVTFIQHADWNEVYNHAIEQSGGYPTPPPAEEAAEDTETDTDAGGDSGDSGGYELDMVDLAFEPVELTIPANTDVTITLVNKGALEHAFAIPDQNIASDNIPGGGTGTVVVNLPPGEYDFDCPIPGHADSGMVGKLIVSEDAPAPGGQAAGAEASPATDGGGDAGSQTEAAAPVDIEMVDLAFEPVEVTIPANADVTLNLINNGALEHAFAIPDQNIASENIPGGATGTLVVNLPPGEYDFVCPIPGHTESGMVGKLIVSESAGSSAEPAAADGESTDEGASGDSGDAAGAPVEIDMVDLAFEPVEVTISADTDVTVNLVNNGALEHAFAIPDQGIASENIPGGGNGTVVVNLPPGEYEFVCPIPGHTESGMVGKLIVE